MMKRTATLSRPQIIPDTAEPQVIAGLVFAETLADGTQVDPSNETTERARQRLTAQLRAGEQLVLESTGRMYVRLGTRNTVRARARLNRMIRALVDRPLSVGGRPRHVDVAATWDVVRGDDRSAIEALLAQSVLNLPNRDLMVRRVDDTRRGIRTRPMVTAAQVALTYALSFGLPFALLVITFQNGTDISGVLYWALVASLAVTGAVQWMEATHAVAAPVVPAAPSEPAPRATAIIAAYLPNEAETIMETLDHFFAQRYSGGLQVILAYNTPYPLPIEDELRALARVNPAFTLVATPESTSKAQNVNAALSAVNGEFVGIFDADHHPMQGAFERAWRWIASGVDIVQGHCVIRNGDESFVARMTSVEFEQIYSVSHPGSQVMNGFGVFGGSNGFWRAQVLREIRLRGLFLTEDIDASIRSVREGRTVVNDRGLLSRELAPTTLRQLSKQRLRWAQGWFQVTLRHVHSALLPASPLDARQRRGMIVLLGWREVFLWLTALMPAVLAFSIWRDGGFASPTTSLLLLTMFTLSSGPIQIWFAYRLGAPEIRQHRGRWVAYLVYSIVFYQEYKNLLGRLAQVKQLFGEKHWAVTPRTSTRLQEEGTEPAVHVFDEKVAA
jgi:cellulose synthase/poly-beta-1,6-N-acetylglucosamine synthase-like glycosyltransferase